MCTWYVKIRISIDYGKLWGICVHFISKLSVSAFKTPSLGTSYKFVLFETEKGMLL